MLMLHDADGGHRTFAPQVEVLASFGYRAVAWDMPGYGHSAPIDPYAFKGLAERCLALVEALQCGPVTLVGHGMGAMLALEVAVRQPAQVGRLVLCAGGPALDAQARELMQGELVRLVGTSGGPGVVFVTHSVDEALADLAQALDFGPTHLSCYQLTIEPNTAFAVSPPTLPDALAAAIRRGSEAKPR